MAIETKMEFDSGQIRELASWVRGLSDLIGDGVDMSRSAHDDLERGWDDDGGAKLRASLTVGGRAASDLEDDATAFAGVLDGYAGNLERAEEHLQYARDLAEANGMLDGTKVHLPDKPITPPGGMPPEEAAEWARMANEHRLDVYEEATVRVGMAHNILSQSGIEELLERLSDERYFMGASFVNGEIEQVARWYGVRFVANAQLRAEAFRAKGFDEDFVNKHLDEGIARAQASRSGLIIRVAKTGVGPGITVFGIAFDIYSGTVPEKAIFKGLGGVAGGAVAVAATPTVWGPGVAVGLGVLGGFAGSWLAELFWDNAVPEGVKDWIADQRETLEENEARHNEGAEWARELAEERGTGPGSDLTGP